MTTKIDGVKVEYTKNGNAYAVTNKGKNIGTVAGVAAAGASLAIPYDSFTCSKTTKTNTFTKIKDFIKGKYDTELLNAANNAKTKGKNFKAFFNNMLAKAPKGGKIAMVTVPLAFISAKVIGAIFDRIKNKKNAKEADQVASELLTSQK